jgi:hypothetical protein
MYDPKPIDVSRVKLPASVVELTEKLAEDVHAIWARQRLNGGWTYGPRRDDTLKTHPNLVPYSELSDAEKAYDRATALGALKAILALGYKIEKA